MKVAVFVVGLVLLFVGLIGAAYGWFVATSLDATHAIACSSSGPGEPYPGFCAAIAASASSYRTFAYGMVALFSVGVVVAVAGGLMGEFRAPAMMMTPPPIPPPGGPPAAFRTCNNCGRSMPTTDRFCPSCGTPQP